MDQDLTAPDLSSGFTLLGRNYCHLCHDMEAALAPLLAPLNLSLRTVDVDQFPELEERWGELVPVLLHEGQEVCHYFLDPVAVGAVLAKIR